ncbi:hypothetical protein CANMA_002533 [Candida margitis]|uniref:uncharacterized protein n=1 Tax=Candida margitis TaxID=1775924 RepID=UPI0022278EBE|nr:uncharacterized protein CANMA_002533 [Candida margitis]KAI5968317.1 hypothetical protein CANMA_002533 [Candida margitis]
MSSSLSTPTFKVGLTSEEKSLYTQLFKSLDTENTGIITGEKARTTFEKSSLPPAILGEIWQLADQNNLGFLNQFGFCYAMRLIGYTQAGHHPAPGLADTPGPLPKFADLQLPRLQSQSTSNSFLSSQPNNAIPGSATPQESIAAVSAADYQRFSQLFAKTVGSVQGELGGTQAKEIFLKARLPTPTLGQIWSLVDRNNSGLLHVGEFVIAMHLVQGVLSGNIKQLPPFLPDYVWKSVESASGPISPPPQSPNLYQNQQSSRQTSVSSQQTAIRHPPADESKADASEWAVTPVMKAQYDSIFNNLDKEHVGHLNPEQVASFLMTSKLDQQDLATIWDLADIQNTGLFTKLEFSIALFLVNRKASGKNLPNVIPDSLISSIKVLGSKPSAEPPARSKSSMDDLVDIFGSPSPQPQPTAPKLEHGLSSSDLSYATKPRLTSSFKPTSSFGQTLLQNHQQSPPSTTTTSTPTTLSKQETSLEKENPAIVPTSAQPPVTQAQQKQVNYDALRSVPPPPAARSTSDRSQPANEDLLADPGHSVQLSQATSDLANVSNQINSLRTQTTNLDDKKSKAETELQRLLNAKVEFEKKLEQLRTSYDNEAKQVTEIEGRLASAKEENEALRSETSIAEAKLNSLSGDSRQKQVALEELQKENSSFKDKLQILNADTTELENQLKLRNNDVQDLQKKVEIKKAQAHQQFTQNEKLKNAIADTEEEYRNLQFELDSQERERLEQEEQQKKLQQQHEELKANKPKKAAGVAAVVGAAAAAGAVGGAVAGVVSGHPDGSEEQDSVSTIEQSEKDKHEDAPVKGVKELSITESGATEQDNGDTPITSPSNSELQYPQGNDAGFAGGMVGMPGVLVGIQRTESLTSSVQNNPPLSVRDDDVEQTLGSDKGSSSFELVEGRSPEFPPIKELDYQESDSEEEEESHFDDAVDNFKQANQHTNQHTNQDTQFDDDMFNDLQPATEDVDENFNLEPAEVENNDTEEFEKPEANKDEWEQLFAGFGNDYLTKSIPEITKDSLRFQNAPPLPSQHNKTNELRKNIINPNILNDIFLDIPPKVEVAKSQRFFNSLKVNLDWTLADYHEIPDVKYEILKAKAMERQATSTNGPKRTFGIKPEMLKMLPEVLLMGRTNAGKSSLINNLLVPKRNLARHEQLAYVSSKAGFTKTMNCFRLSNQLRMVDSPGYGRGGVETQGEMVLAYINNRKQLQRVLLLIPSDLKKEDMQLVQYLIERDVSFDIVFTKLDDLLKKFLRKDIFKQDNAQDMIKEANQRVVEHYATLIDELSLQDVSESPRFMFNNAQTNNFLTDFSGLKTIRYNLLKSCNLV